MVQHWEEATKQAAQRPLLKSTENGTSAGSRLEGLRCTPVLFPGAWDRAGRFTLYSSPVPRHLGTGLEGSRCTTVLFPGAWE